MEPNQFTQGISAESWDTMAKLAQTSTEDFRSKYEALISQGPQQMTPTVTVGEAVSSDNCINRDFDIGISNLISLSGTISFCFSSPTDWSAAVHVCLVVAGSSVWCTDYTLSPQNTSICYNPSLPLVKGQLCIGLEGNNFCFNVNGKACYWAITWHCDDFNQTLFCFK